MEIKNGLTKYECEKCGVKPQKGILIMSFKGFWLCGKCVNQCCYKIDIPTLMRSYMYAYGYNNLAHARENMSNAGIADVPCRNCDLCEVKCVMGFDIKNKILEIVRLKNVPTEILT